MMPSEGGHAYMKFNHVCRRMESMWFGERRAGVYFI